MFKFTEKTSVTRLSSWKNFRQYLETSLTPFEDVINFFHQFPHVKIYTDPYDKNTWPTPWELINENEYCPFNLILAICYTLQLCDRFKDISPIIKISVDKINKTVYYLLFIDDKVYGYDYTSWISAKTLPTTLKDIKIYHMPPLH